MTQEEQDLDEPKRSLVSLDDDNETILLNDEPKYAVALPVNISRKNASSKKDIIEKLILDGCDKYRFDYVSEDNIKNRAKEVVDQLYERPRELKTGVSVSDVIRMNEGRVMTTAAKLIGVSPPYKLITKVTLECRRCKSEWEGGLTTVTNQFPATPTPTKSTDKTSPISKEVSAVE